MDMLKGDRIAAADLADWRKLAQGLHARYLTSGFGAAAEFVSRIAPLAAEIGHAPSIAIGEGYVDLRLLSHDAIYRAGDGTEHVVQWVTQKDLDLAERISIVAAELGLDPSPTSVSMMEIALNGADPSRVAPFWAALLTGLPEARGLGTPGDEIRDPTDRVPHLMFADAASHGQSFEIEIYIPLDAREDRVAAILASGGEIVDDSRAPGVTVFADPEGNRGVICVDVSAVRS